MSIFVCFRLIVTGKLICCSCKFQLVNTANHAYQIFLRVQFPLLFFVPLCILHHNSLRSTSQGRICKNVSSLLLELSVITFNKDNMSFRRVIYRLFHTLILPNLLIFPVTSKSAGCLISMVPLYLQKEPLVKN